jgi:hypothetical protein
MGNGVGGQLISYEISNVPDGELYCYSNLPVSSWLTGCDWPERVRSAFQTPRQTHNNAQLASRTAQPLVFHRH